jgi:hypothetical protein
MVLVLAVALLLTALRFAANALPHVRQCWELAAREEQRSQAYRAAAARYRSCVQSVPCSAAEYCYNACLTHASARSAGHPVGSDPERARAAAAQHRRAADDHERVAALHAAMARLYRRAMFRFSEPQPDWMANEEAAARLLEPYRCDSF